MNQHVPNSTRRSAIARSEYAASEASHPEEMMMIHPIIEKLLTHIRRLEDIADKLTKSNSVS